MNSSLKSPRTLANQWFNQRARAQGQPLGILHAALQWPRGWPRHLAMVFKQWNLAQNFEIWLNSWNFTQEFNTNNIDST